MRFAVTARDHAGRTTTVPIDAASMSEAIALHRTQYQDRVVVGVREEALSEVGQ